MIRILFHLFMTAITGGWWFVGILIKYFLG